MTKMVLCVAFEATVPAPRTPSAPAKRSVPHVFPFHTATFALINWRSLRLVPTVKGLPQAVITDVTQDNRQEQAEYAV